MIIRQRDAFRDQTRANERQTRNDGEVNVITRGKNSKKDHNEGSYVDYEEVE